MAISAKEFTELKGEEDERLKAVEKEIDDLLAPKMEEAKRAGLPVFEFRYSFKSETSSRIREEIRRRYEDEHWHAAWTTQDRDGLYLKAVIRERRASR